MFLWKYAHNCIPAKAIVFSHLPQDLQRWSTFIIVAPNPEFYPADIREWYYQNMPSKMDYNYITWPILFAFTIWICWLHSLLVMQKNFEMNLNPLILSNILLLIMLLNIPI
jgi:hypothetical protein